ncbi:MULTISPECIES: serine hydrolase domain-containing protein [unclassified Brevundimonas]|uniref:serine hydrolase domain-containing protein n=1 Tax=unclassified Brevundimonas TaxID=2622653 RepID=UPI0025C5665A|nr:MULTISPECIES: serine hydrolase domain-containing protein [unclassified Brevundimonas]
MSKYPDVRAAALQNPDRRLLLGAGLFAGAATVLPRWAIAREADLDAALDRALTTHKPAALSGAIWRDGSLVWKGAAGLRRAGGNEAVSLTDKWHLGSNSKAMTAAVWARFVEQGKVAWNEPLPDVVSRAYPGLTVHGGWSDRTVEDLMRHRAGLYDQTHVTPQWIMTAAFSKDPPTVQRHAMLASVLAAAPDGPLGTYSYGNANYILAGALLEGLGGQTWEALMQAELFEPLGIGSGGFGAPKGDQPWGHTDAGTAVDPATIQSDNPAVLGPAGTVHMNLDDYGRFLNAMMTPGWLSGGSLSYLLTPLAGEVYALGWGAPGVKAWAQGPAFVHNGSNTMWFATAVLAPTRKMAFVTVSNDADKGGPACSALIREMLNSAGAN